MSRVKITVTIDEALIEELDRLSGERKANRSRLVEEAVKCWRRRQLEEELIQGYRAMAGEDAETAEARLAARRETLT